MDKLDFGDMNRDVEDFLTDEKVIKWEKLPIL